MNSKKATGPNMGKEKWWQTMVLNTGNFFHRFSQLCNGMPKYTFDEFIEINHKKGLSIGQALSQDMLFMNGLRSILI
jgi:hypothetical protein